MKDAKDDIRPEAIVKIIKTEPEDRGLKNIPVTPANYKKFEGDIPKGLPRGILWGIGGLIVLFIGGFFVSFYVLRAKVVDSITKDLGTLRTGVLDLQNLDPQSAAHTFASLQDPSRSDVGALLGGFGLLFRGGADALTAFSDLSNGLGVLAQELTTIETNAFGLLATGDGAPLVRDLKSLQATVGVIDDASNKLSDAASFAGGLSSLGGGDIYLSLKAQVEGVKKFLDIFVPWLADEKPHHILVFLDNPSEIRPGGGFLGSYADVTIASGTVTDVAVHDIADVDTAFTQNITPPKPLQLAVTRWRPADANWFFDFPTTASKTIAFFEASSLYAKTSTTFDGAIAISPNVVSDLLAITGPIAIGKPTTTFTADNFVVQIQKIVQNGQATSATYPKQVLRDLSQALFAKLASSTEASRQDILSTMLDWAANRDAMVYMKNPDLEAFLDSYGATGASFEIPQKFNGDYLAVVDANVGGGKSDLYVSSTVTYTGVLNEDGTLTSHLSVARKHNGDKSPYWWYKTTSQDYLQVFVPAGVTLVNATGGAQKKITAKVNYAKGGYSTDPLVASIEATETGFFNFPSLSSHEEDGKKVFTTWMVIKAGAKATTTLDYTHRLFIAPGPGVGYQFVFEKQAGTVRHYDIEVDAPLGYIFAENKLASFLYSSDDIPGRLVVNLTLERIP